MGGLCQLPSAKTMYSISYGFNMTLLIVLIVKQYLRSFMSICLLSKMLHQTPDYVLYYQVDPYYEPLLWFMIYDPTYLYTTMYYDLIYGMQSGNICMHLNNITAYHCWQDQLHYSFSHLEWNKFMLLYINITTYHHWLAYLHSHLEWK